MDTQGYEPYRRDKALYKQFGDLSSRGAKIEIKVFDFGLNAQDRIVLFSLDDQRTWELAVPAGSSEFSGRRHTELLNEVEQQLAREDAASLEAFFQKIILGSTRGPLVLNGLARERKFYHHESAAGEPPSEELTNQVHEMLVLPNPVEQKASSEGEAPAQDSDGVGSAERASVQVSSRSGTSNRTAKIGRSRQGKRTSTSAHQPDLGQPAGLTDDRGEDTGPGSDYPSSTSKAPNIIEQLLKRRQKGDA